MSRPVQAPETSGATTRLVLGFVRERAGEDAVRRVLARAQLGLPLEQLDRESTWISYASRIRLFAAAVEVLDEPDVMFRIGGSGLRQSVNPGLMLMLRALGSPRDVFAQLPRAVPKFTTTSTMVMRDVAADRAVIDYRLHDRYPHSRLDCEYAQGLFSIVPELFGLPCATVVHERCQSDGWPSCHYEVHWTARSRLPWRRRAERRNARAGELKLLRRQVDSLQSASADLVSSENLDTVLQRIVERAATAVLAQGYLLAVHCPHGGPPRVHATGITDGHARHLASELLASSVPGAETVVVDVASARRHHGRLAAIHASGQQGLDAERQLLSAYARHAAAALDTVIALDDARRGERRAHALLHLATELAGAVTAPDVARVVTRILPEIVETDRTSVLLWDRDAEELALVASSGLEADEVAGVQAHPLRPHETPELAEMLHRPRPVSIELSDAHPALRRALSAAGAERIMVTPVVSDGRLLGVVTADARQDSGPRALEDMRERLQGVASQAVPALLNAELVAAMRRQSLHDSLTGLPNRQFFAERVARAAVDARAHGVRVGLLFCDVNHFKRINDTYGHAAGDDVLRAVGSRLATCMREHDFLARLSGDEFVILLPDLADHADAHRVADRVSIALAPPVRVGSHDVHVGVSVGVAVQDGGAFDVDLLVREADAAMYRTKHRSQRGAHRSAAGQASR